MKKWSTRHLVILGMLTALEIVLSRFVSINAWNMKIGFSFVPVVVTALLYGPVSAAAVAALGDFLGAILFPIGPYFPGFTLTAALTGAVFGLFLHKEQTTPRILGAVAVNQLVLSLLLNSLWISILYGSSFKGLMATRLGQCAILIPAQLILIFALKKVWAVYGKKIEV